MAAVDGTVLTMPGRVDPGPVCTSHNNTAAEAEAFDEGNKSPAKATREDVVLINLRELGLLPPSPPPLHGLPKPPIRKLVPKPQVHSKQSGQYKTLY
jgi:hypothetical protein